MFVYHNSRLVPIDAFGAFGTKIVLSIPLGPGQSIVLEIISRYHEFLSKVSLCCVDHVDLMTVEL